MRIILLKLYVWREKPSETLDLEEDADIHESYRPKHKYKFGSGYKDFTKRSSEPIGEVDEDYPMQYAIMFKNNEPVGILQVTNILNYLLRFLNEQHHLYRASLATSTYLL